jgi:hypothetical protein
MFAVDVIVSCGTIVSSITEIEHPKRTRMTILLSFV